MPTKEPVQLTLFETTEGRNDVAVINLHLSTKNIWQLYNRCTVAEKFIDELKTDFAAAGFRTNHLWSNDALVLTRLIAYNLLNYIRCLTLTKPLRTGRIKRLGFTS